MFESSCRGNETSLEFKVVSTLRDFSYRRKDNNNYNKNLSHTYKQTTAYFCTLCRNI